VNTSIIIGSDHRGYNLKRSIFQQLEYFKGNETIPAYNFAKIHDVGAYTSDLKTDYPHIAYKLVKTGWYGPEAFTHGILVCGSGFGVSIAANRFDKIRAVPCRTHYEATKAVQHNNMNVLCLGSDFTMDTVALDIVKAFFEATFEGGRHADRVDILSSKEFNDV
jgi:ribose 5-phosphate isomerase B